MEELVEIRWHGRGGQGLVTAAKILAETAIIEGKYAQAIPEYGAERRGAPVLSFNRISSSFYKGFHGVANPELVMVLDEGLLKSVDVTKGLLPGGAIIINTPRKEGVLKVEDGEVFVVNASQIARECTGRAIPNTTMIGALIKVKPLVKLETVAQVVEHSLGFAATEKIIKTNIKALQRGYEEVKKIWPL